MKLRCADQKNSCFLTVGFWLLLILISGTASEGHAETRWIDLTHTFDDQTIYWPTSKNFKLEEVFKGKNPKGFWYEANNYSAAEHGGTHMDSPVHFSRGRWTVDEIPLERLIGPAILVDVRSKASAKPDYLIQKSDFLEWEKRHGLIPPDTIILVRTGWEQFWPDKKKYMGTDQPGDVAHLHFPGFSREAAHFLTLDRKVKAVGLDTASLDFGQSKDFPAHQVFGEANVPGFENLHNLNQLPARGFQVFALPMKIGKGSGAPLRIIAKID